jgi:enoyl-CoA hydratase/3-hydroxyacyl-CoA dehydrogenase
VSRKLKSEEKVGRVMALLRPTLEYKDFGGVELVIEAALEKLSLKQQIFADLERHCSPTCILASNTSTIDIEAIGQRTKAKDRILGLHFFSPGTLALTLTLTLTSQPM